MVFCHTFESKMIYDKQTDTGAYIHTTSKSAQFWFSAQVFVFT